MSGELEFSDENEYRSPEILGAPRRPELLMWLKNKGVVKSERQAANVAITFSVLAIILAILIPIFMFNDFSTPENNLSPREEALLLGTHPAP